LTFKGKFVSSNSIAGKAIFITSTIDEENFMGLRSMVGLFTAPWCRITDNLGEHWKDGDVLPTHSHEDAVAALTLSKALARLGRSYYKRFSLAKLLIRSFRNQMGISTTDSTSAHKSTTQTVGAVNPVDYNLSSDNLPDEPLVTIEANRSWGGVKLSDLWAYRDLLYFLTWRDVKVRYKQNGAGSGLGHHFSRSSRCWFYPLLRPFGGYSI